MNRQRFSVKSAVAAHLGEDRSTLDEERRYQSTRTPCPIYTVGNDYLTATSSLRPGPKRSKEWPAWELVRDDSYAAAMGWRIWRAKTEAEVPVMTERSMAFSLENILTRSIVSTKAYLRRLGVEEANARVRLNGLLFDMKIEGGRLTEMERLREECRAVIRDQTS